MVTPIEDHYSDHDGGRFAPIETTTVATWKAPASLENLGIDGEGAVFVTVYSHNRVDRYDPATGATTTLAELPAPPMEFAFNADDVLWVTDGTLYERPGFICRGERTGAVRHTSSDRADAPISPDARSGRGEQSLVAGGGR